LETTAQPSYIAVGGLAKSEPWRARNHLQTQHQGVLSSPPIFHFYSALHKHYKTPIHASGAVMTTPINHKLTPQVRQWLHRVIAPVRYKNRQTPPSIPCLGERGANIWSGDNRSMRTHRGLITMLLQRCLIPRLYRLGRMFIVYFTLSILPIYLGFY